MQLGTQLNKCAQNGDRAKFALLLSMLSTDVTDQTQIHTQETVAVDRAEEAARLARMNAYAASNNFAAMRLEICMAEEKSIATGDINFVPELVSQNMSHLQQLKLAESDLVKPAQTVAVITSESGTNSEAENESMPSLLDVLNSYDASKPLQIKSPA